MYHLNKIFKISRNSFRTYKYDSKPPKSVFVIWVTFKHKFFVHLQRSERLFFAIYEKVISIDKILHSQIIAWRYYAFCGGIPCMNDISEWRDELKILWGRWWVHVNIILKKRQVVDMLILFKLFTQNLIASVLNLFLTILLIFSLHFEIQKLTFTISGAL